MDIRLRKLILLFHLWHLGHCSISDFKLRLMECIGASEVMTVRCFINDFLFQYDAYFNAISLYDILHTTIVDKLLYCSPAWSGFCSAADISRLDTFLKRCTRYCYCLDNFPTVSEVLNYSQTQMTNFFRELLTSKHMFSCHYCQPTLNTPIICETDLITIL